MKKFTGIHQFLFFLWVGLAFTILWTFHDFSNFPFSFLQAVLNNTWRVVYVVVVNFIFFEYTIPFVLRKRRYPVSNILLAFAAIFIHLMLWSYGLYAWRSLGVSLQFYTPFIAKGANLLESVAAYSFSSVFFFGVSRHIYHHIKLRQAAQQLKIEKQSAELNYLRSQTNPHFLFNTLNNIYSLSRDKSDLAPESILRLSKILRFMLYETGGDFVSVEQELKIIGDYIELEKLRYDESLRINFNYDVEDRKQAIPPLILIPLVENAFKHGVSETRGRPFIDIHLSIKSRRLHFQVKNSTEDVPEGRVVKENIGLSNLRRQLELLYTDYALSLEQGKTAFSAMLTINLGSHV
jgi:two-component system LytT family sensor kinase